MAADVAIQHKVLRGPLQVRLPVLEELLGCVEASRKRCLAPGQLRRVGQPLQVKPSAQGRVCAMAGGCTRTGCA